MAGLVGYDSSDEDVESSHAALTVDARSPAETTVRATATTSAQESALAPESSDTMAPMLGPLPPPSAPLSYDDPFSRPSSPYTALRSQLRDYTQPPAIAAEIPQSPPGSPDPTANARISRFMELKKHGVHFNEDLAKKTTFRNPSLLSVMMARAGVEDEAQYTSSLPKDFWDVSRFPEWAYKEGLLRRQQELRERDEQDRKIKSASGKRAIDWISGGKHSDPVKSETPPSGIRGSAAERVMAGLSRERTESPKVNEHGKRKRP